MKKNVGELVVKIFLSHQQFRLRLGKVVSKPVKPLFIFKGPNIGNHGVSKYTLISKQTCGPQDNP
jgi:hypothetical protein